MTELVFQVENDPDGGFTAKAVGASVFTQAETLEDLRRMVRDAVACHFEDPALDHPSSISMPYRFIFL
ncbi:MAG: 2-oxoisovalerate dehydrogenase E1 subunit beta [Planctomycetes bacterium]|nr:2-oxoisovalerate dehydrogenase E1 subunit beta [Planctomycetota bacterium]